MTTRRNSTVARPARRKFMLTAAATGGGLALGFPLPFPASEAAAAEAGSEVGIWVLIKPDDTCVVRIARSEIGQGILTGLAQLVAEELDCDWNKVTTELVTPSRNYALKRAWGDMMTAGARSIRTSQDYVRRGGAAARSMLLKAAADRWQVPVDELTVAKGIVTHAASKRSTSYGKLAAAAARLPVPDAKTLKLKVPSEWVIAGKPLKRLDTADKLDGSKVYAIDLKLPGMLYAAVKSCPVFGGKLAGWDESKISGRPGVKRVVRVNASDVAVVADTWWRAKAALDALPIQWDEGPNAQASSAKIAEHLKSGLSGDAYADRNEGDALKAIEGAARKVEAVYGTPFLAHATMEPMNCTARVTAERAEAWVPTQNGEASLAALSEESGLALDKCAVYKLDPGGGFGRRVMQDYLRQAVVIAKHFPGVPVKLIWTREEDMAHDFYRPISQCKLTAGLDDKGNLAALHVRLSGQSINAFANPSAIKDGKNPRQLQGLWARSPEAELGYSFPNLLVEYAIRNTHVPVGTLRGVNTNHNGVYMECFIDEAAKAAGKDPVEFRRALMGRHPKHLAVLNVAAERGDWGKPLPAGRHRGIAQFMGYASYQAAVAEVSVSQSGTVKVHRITMALNCGHVVNPQQVAAQVEGSVAYGLSMAFYGECTVENGRIAESNFDKYQILRMAEMPKVETVLVPTFDFWGGVGEAIICVVAPAVMNAIFAATGKPVRNLPIKNQKLV